MLKVKLHFVNTGKRLSNKNAYDLCDYTVNTWLKISNHFTCLRILHWVLLAVNAVFLKSKERYFAR